MLTCFASPVSDGDAYLACANRASRPNVRYVILGDLRIAIRSSNLGAVNELLALAALSADFAALDSRMGRPLPSLIAELGQDAVRIPDSQIGKRPPNQAGKVELAPLWM